MSSNKSKKKTLDFKTLNKEANVRKFNLQDESINIKIEKSSKNKSEKLLGRKRSDKNNLKKSKSTKEKSKISPNKNFKINNNLNKQSTFLTANDFLNMLNEYNTEYMSLKDFNLQKTINQLTKNDINTINSDLSNLNLNLISKAKLENLKPFKAIENINNTEKQMSESDKEISDSIKQLSHIKINNKNEIKQPILKCLLNYSKKEISNSYIIKIFDLCNKTLFTHNSADKSNHQIADKNKTSYQSFLAEKLNSFSLENEDLINNKDIWKSIVYIANKIMKSNLLPNLFINTNDTNSLKTENFNESFKSILYSKKLHKALTKSLENTILSDKSLLKSIKYKLMGLVSKDNFDLKEDSEDIVTSFLDILCKEKEDDLEKAFRRCDKIKSLFTTNKTKMLEHKNSILVKLRIAYLITAYNHGFSEIISEEHFWKSFMDFLKENSINNSNKKLSSYKKKQYFYNYRKEKKELTEPVNCNIVYPIWDDIKIEENKEDILNEDKNQKETTDINNTSHINDHNEFDKFELLLHKSWLLKLSKKEEIFDIIKSKYHKSIKNTPKKEKIIKEKCLKSKIEKEKKLKGKKSKVEKLDNNINEIKIDNSIIKEDINRTISDESDLKSGNKDHETVEIHENEIEYIIENVSEQKK